MVSKQRRQVLIGLAGSALVVLHACAVFKRESELDAAIAELDSMLQSISDDDYDSLALIVEKISERSRRLLETHEEFTKAFNQQGMDRQVPASSLEALVREYDTRRLALRGELLLSQDDLHAAVGEDDWPDVLAVLNKKSRAIVPQRARES